MILDVRPLVTSDADALTAPIQVAPFYQPAFIAETALDLAGQTAMPTGLTDIADNWRVTFELASPMPGFVVYPFCFIGNLINLADAAGFANLFETRAVYSVSIAPGTASSEGWQQFDMGDPFDINPITGRVQTIAPNLRGFPMRPRSPGGGGFGIRVGDMILTIQTPDVEATAATSLTLDFRLLLFPEAAAQNAGFYTPGLFFHPQ